MDVEQAIRADEARWAMQRPVLEHATDTWEDDPRREALETFDSHPGYFASAPTRGPYGPRPLPFVPSIGPSGRRVDGVLRWRAGRCVRIAICGGAWRP